MAAVNFELRHYQRETLDVLATYLSRIGTMTASTAFYDVTGRAYSAAPLIPDSVPYVCLRVPTGGGKTVMAAHSVGIAATGYLQTGSPMVLWFVPSTTIRDQTLDALKDEEHPYRAALHDAFGRNVTVMSLPEALHLTRADAEGGACVVVATLQSFRVDDKEGRKVYESAGALMGHFTGLDPEQDALLERDADGSVPYSLANMLRLHRPMVIVDEAHNARTALSFETLRRLAPSLILELTATPETTHDPEKDKFASNVLHHVSAAELKAEEMIKLPVRLRTNRDWRLTVGKARDAQRELEEKAKREEAVTGDYIRPVVLFQAERKGGDVTVDVLRKHLIDDARIPEKQIAVATGTTREIDGVDLFDRDCDIRFIITINALKEGWDCSFAYILCSVAEIKSAKSVEQLLGRILRMPGARRKTDDALNRAYAFVASADFTKTAETLTDGLVEGNGYNRLEAAELVKAQTALDFPEADPAYEHKSDPLDFAGEFREEDVTGALDRLPAQLKARVRYDATTREIVVRGAVSVDDKKTMQLATLAIPGASAAIQRLYLASNRIAASETRDDAAKPPFIVPRLCIPVQGKLELFRRDHFLDLPWRLDECDPSGVLSRFTIRDDAKTGEIDVTDDGEVKWSMATLHRQLELAIHEPDWTFPRLVNWIDRGIPHGDVTKPSAKIFVSAALTMLEREKGYSLAELARHRWSLRRAIAAEIAALRGKREAECYGALFKAEAASFRTVSHPDTALIFDENGYAYNQPYRGSRTFRKHYFPVIGDLKNKGEEFECACYIDDHPKVRYWVRNVDRKPNAFWLQLPKDRFFPDFVAMLDDGRIMAIEYKGGDRYEAEVDKRMIGECWADASDGHCLFTMPTERGFDRIDRAIQVKVQ